MGSDLQGFSTFCLDTAWRCCALFSLSVSKPKHLNPPAVGASGDPAARSSAVQRRRAKRDFLFSGGATLSSALFSCGLSATERTNAACDETVLGPSARFPGVAPRAFSLLAPLIGLTVLETERFLLSYPDLQEIPSQAVIDAPVCLGLPWGGVPPPLLCVHPHPPPFLQCFPLQFSGFCGAGGT